MGLRGQDYRKMKRLVILLSALGLLSILAYAQEAKQLAGGYAQLSLKQQEQAAKMIELFETFYEIPDGSCNNAYKVKHKLDRRLAKMHKGKDEQYYSDFFYDQIKSTLQTRNMQQMTYDINRFVYFFPTDHRVEALLKVKARTNIEQRNWMQLDKTIREMKRYAESTGADCNETITQLTEELNQLMATESYERALQGVWVSDSVHKKSGIPLLALRIYEEGVELYKGTSFEKTKKLKGELPTNFYFSSGTAIDSTGCFEASFFARNVNPANTNLANHAIGQAQSNLSHGLASIEIGNTGGMVSGLAGAGMNILFAYAMSQSSTIDAGMILRMKPRNENVMDVDIRLLSDVSKSTDPILVKKYEKTMHTVLYKVNAADNAVLYTDTPNNNWDLGYKPISFYQCNQHTQESDFNNLASFKRVKIPFFSQSIMWLTGIPTFGLFAFEYGAIVAWPRKCHKQSKHNFKIMNEIKEQAMSRQALIDAYMNQYPINENESNN